MTDPLLARLTFDPGVQELTPVPWPPGLAPSPSETLVGGGPMEPADVLVVTYTTAEARALADVLTPGHPYTSWLPYTKNWAAFASQLTGRSPAREARCSAYWWATQIGGINVVVAKSELHLATDGLTAPIVELWQQMIGDVNPRLVITTGTAGGIGASIVLGDVSVAAAAQFNCTKAFAGKPWAHARYVSPAGAPSVTPNIQAAEALIAVNAARLQPVATRDPVIITGGDVETIDFFGFDDTDDSYGVRADDPQAVTEEMDDACLGLAVSGLSTPVPWLSVRNASDPQVPSSVGTLAQQAAWANSIYEKYGYWTTVGSAIVCWALIADRA